MCRWISVKIRSKRIRNKNVILDLGVAPNKDKMKETSLNGLTTYIGDKTSLSE